MRDDSKGTRAEHIAQGMARASVVKAIVLGAAGLLTMLFLGSALIVAIIVSSSNTIGWTAPIVLAGVSGATIPFAILVGLIVRAFPSVRSDQQRMDHLEIQLRSFLNEATQVGVPNPEQSVAMQRQIKELLEAERDLKIDMEQLTRQNEHLERQLHEQSGHIDQMLEKMGEYGAGNGVVDGEADATKTGSET